MQDNHTYTTMKGNKPMKELLTGKALCEKRKWHCYKDATPTVIRCSVCGAEKKFGEGTIKEHI
jgi:hypothetical protein